MTKGLSPDSLILNQAKKVLLVVAHDSDHDKITLDEPVTKTWFFHETIFDIVKTLFLNGGAGILRAIASWIEFHLSSSYVLFNLKALSTVTGRLLFVDGSCSLDNLFRW
jgi:hypothetical protein